MIRPFFPDKTHARELYLQLEKRLGFRTIETPHSVALTAYWWQIFRPALPSILSTFVVESLIWVFITSGPVLIVEALTNSNLVAFWIFALAFAATWLGGLVNIYWYCRSIARLMSGVEVAAIEKFMSADPIHHSTRSTGTIISKIENAVSATEDIPDIIAFNVIPFVAAPIVLLTIFFRIDSGLGTLVAISLGIILGLSIYLTLYLVRVVIPVNIESKDQVKAAGVESLQQFFLVRASLQTLAQMRLLRTRTGTLSRTRATTWTSFVFAIGIVRGLYTLLCILVTYRLVLDVQAGLVAPALALGGAYALFNAYPVIVNAGRQFEKLLQNIAKLQDLCTYAQEFGTQTIPLRAEVAGKAENPAVLEAEFSFSFGETEKLFADHTIHLSLDDSPGLYGLVGPSGTGKTTLLSILGGQLKPVAGRILICGQDVYRVGEEQRKTLLALQQQTASSLRGTLTHNLTFGLPVEQVPETRRLVTLLQDVGLWSLFRNKQGLETFIGEGGITLSGGQRQRLNFASLYLRANYYRPGLVLIDEPTSSLDEISEQKITALIDELAAQAVVIVVAHRLKTLEQARGIFDTSLLQTQKEIIFYPLPELARRSVYYREVRSGRRRLEE